MSKNKGLILTIDLSSSRCNVFGFDVNGEIIYQRNSLLKNRKFEGNIAEIDPEQMLRTIYKSIRMLRKEADKYKIIGVGVTAQLGLVAIAKNGEAISPILTWMDKRAGSQVEKMTKKIDEEKIYQISGRRLSPELSAPKILWFKENQSEIYENTAKFLTLKDFIIYKLTGEFGIDPAHASYSMLYNVKKEEWDQELLRELEIDLNKLPPVYDSFEIIGKVNKKAAEASGLQEGIPVAVGGPDGSIGAVGAGLIEPDLAINVVGTTDVFLTCSQEPIFDPEMRIVVNSHLVPGLWSIGGPMSMTGGCLQWFAEEFAASEKEVASRTDTSLYELLDKEAARAEVGASDLLFFTSLVGERTPNWDPNMRGSILGLTPQHSKGELVRAILEGSSFAVKQVIDIIEELGINIEEILMIGGGAKSRVWPQIRSNVTGKRYSIPRISEATAFGTFMAAAVGIGIYDNYTDAKAELIDIKRVYKPEREKQQKYQDIYRSYRRIFELLQQIYNIW